MKLHYKYRPGLFFGLVFLVTYLFWFFGAHVSQQSGRGGFYTFTMFLGLITPFVISTYMIISAKNAALRKDFFNRLTNLKLIKSANLPVLVFLMPAVVIVSILVSLVFGGSVEQFRPAQEFSFTMGDVSILLVLVLAAAFEELGWRGYAFDALRNGRNLFRASLIFSVLWSLWHLPLLWVDGSYQQQIYEQNIWFAVNFFVSIIPMGIILSWICIGNNRSILAAILFHFIINLSQEGLSMTQATKSIETGVLVIVALAIIYLDRDTFFGSD